MNCAEIVKTVSRAALAAMAPAAAPMKNHLGGATDAAEGAAAAGDLERVVAFLSKRGGLGLSSVRSACAAVSFARQALQSMAKS